MACFHPRPGWLNRYDGGRLLFRSPVGEDPRDYVMGIARCRHCVGCLCDRARDVSIRAAHEAHTCGVASFLTLTYSREYLPEHGSLRRKDFELFMMRLRTYLLRNHGVKVRAYFVGEYGGRTGRAHYHCCLFGWDFSSDWVPAGRSKMGHAMYTSRTLDELWGKGMCWVNHMGVEVAQYAAKYAIKGQGGDRHSMLFRVAGGQLVSVNPREHRGFKGWPVERPFDSLPHGKALGLPFLDRYWSDVFPRGLVILAGGTELPAPSAYMKALKARDEDLFSHLVAKRSIEGLPRLEDFMPDRLPVRESVALARATRHERDAV